MKKNLATNAAFNILYRMLNVIFPLITATYVSRILEPAGIGAVGYAQNIVSYFLMFAALGIPVYGTRETAKCKGNPKELSKLVSELLTINFLSTTVCLACYLLVIRNVFHSDVSIYLVFTIDLLFNYINIDWLYQGQEEYGYITLRNFVIKIISLIALVVFVKEQDDCVAYAVIVCMGTDLNYLANIIHARSIVRITLCGLDLRKHLKPIFILLASSATASIYSKIDVTMLGWISTKEAVGYYTNAFKVMSICLTMATAISAVFLPRLCHIYNNQREEYQKVLSLGLKAVIILAIPCWIGLMLVADDLVLTFFGDLFLPAVPTLRILASLIVIRGVGDIICYQVIISTGNEKKLINSRIIAAAVNVVLNGLLIRNYAQNGVAVASVASELIVNVGMLFCSLAIVKPSVERSFWISVLIGTVAMAVSVLLVQHLVPGAGLCLFLSAAIGVVIYFLSELLLKNDMVMDMLQLLRTKAPKIRKQ